MEFLDAFDRYLTSLLDLAPYEAINGYPLTHISAPFFGTLIFFVVLFVASKFNFKNVSISHLLRFYLLISHRQDFSKLTLFHNVFLSLLSGIMFFSLAWSYFNNSESGFELFCRPQDWSFPSSIQFWVYIFYLSKFYEYLDTLILVLKKRDVSFLQFYHHTIVPWIVWTFVRSNCALTVQGVLWNSGVHTIMYYYYALGSLGYRDIWWKKYLTLIQILQFVSSLLLGSIFSFFVYLYGQDNCRGFNAFLFTTLFNITFLILFLDLFKKNNPHPTSKKPASKVK